jgi:hypothetical protein
LIVSPGLLSPLTRAAGAVETSTTTAVSRMEAALAVPRAEARLTPCPAIVVAQAALTVCTLSSGESAPALSTLSGLKRSLAVCS